jgi:hypothetical protein
MDALSVVPARLTAASVTVFLTTLEDTLWLVPLLNPNHFILAVSHALLYILTFTLLSLSIGVLTLFITRSAVDNLENQDVVLSVAGACFCWIVAAILYYKAWQKRLRRVKIQEENESTNDDEEECFTTASETYGAAATSSSGADEVDALTEVDEPPKFQLWLVVTLTVIGAIDEVSYFPGLIAGGIFSVAELTLGTTIASVMILLIVCVFLAPCQPVLDFLDQIPLYFFVSIFAIILTADAVWQALTLY